MKNVVLMVLVLIASLSYGQGGTTSSDLYPAVTGQNLGNPSQRWNVYANNLDVAGTTTMVIGNIVYCGAPGIGDPAACLLQAQSLGKHVVFPSGRYTITASLIPYNNLTVDCTAGDVVGAGGTVFVLSGAIWGVSNPNADLNSGTGSTNEVRSMAWRDCGFDMSGDATVLGAIRMKGINWSKFYGISVYTNGNTNPAITFDGANFAHNGGNYNNDWFGLTLYDNSTTASDIGVYMTDTTSSGQCSNDDHFFGGSWSQFGTPLKIDCGNNNGFYSIDMENWRVYGIYLTALSSGSAFNNIIESPRLEKTPADPTGVGIQIDSIVDGSSRQRVRQNQIIKPYHSGTYTWMTDETNANFCIQCLTDATNATYQTLLNNPFGFGYEYVGINATPSQNLAALGGFTGGLNIGNGNLNVAGNSTLGGTLKVTGNTTLNGTFGVDTSSGNVTATYTPFTGATTINYGIHGSSTKAYILTAQTASYCVFDTAGSYFPFCAFANGTTQVISGSRIKFGATSGYNFYDGTALTNSVAQISTSGQLAILGNGNFANYVQFIGPSMTGARSAHVADGDNNLTLAVALATAAATTDNVTIQGMTASGHCVLTPTNAAAATNIATTYISNKTTNQITVTHTATGGMDYDILCTPN